MKLFIDTSSAEEITLGIDKKRFKTKARQEKSQKLLPFIGDTLKKQGKKFEDIKEIEVNVGPGSYTGLRVGVAVANTIGWVLNVPVNGKYLRKGGVVEIKYD